MARTLNPEGYFDPVMSAEEFYLTCESILEDANQLTNITDEIERLQDASDSLEDLTITGNHIKVVTPEHAIMLDAGIRSTLSGSDVSTDDVIPNLESYIGKRFNMEGLKDHLVNLWRWIVQKLEEAWKIIYDFGYKYLGTIPRLRGELEKIRKKALSGDLDTNQWPSKFNVGMELYSLSVGDKVPKMPRDLIDTMENLNLQVQHFLGPYFENYVTVYEDLKALFDEVGEEGFDNNLNQMTDKVLTLTDTGLPSELTLTTISDKRFTGNYKQLANLPNNKTIYLKDKADIPNNEAILRAEMVQGMAPILRETKSSLKRSQNVYELGTLYPNDIVQVIDACMDILNACEKVMRGEWFDKLKVAKKDLQISSDALIKADPDNRNDLKVTYIRAMVKYNTMMTGIYSQLIVGLTTVSLVSCRSIGIICAKNIRL